MSEINDLITKPAQTVVVNKSLHSSIGYVTKINEKENTCDIRYVNSFGKITSKENVEVLIRYNTDSWFPTHLGEQVTIEEANDSHPVITGSLVDFFKDIKMKRRYNKDVQPGRKYQVRGKIAG